MNSKIRSRISQTGLALSLLVPAIGMSATVDLALWTAESYGSPGSWTVAPGGGSVTQSVNGNPTFFYSPFNVIGTDVRGTIVSRDSDDDFVGFALGFRPGDSTSASANYLLIDWKQGTQNTNFSDPFGVPGTTALRGLAVSRVTGVPVADEFWGHTNSTLNPGGGLQELARATNLGSTGWVRNRNYTFRFVFQADQLQVYVDDVLELDIAGSFADGRMAFYNLSQANVTYGAFTVETTQVPVPGAGWLMATGMVGLWANARRRRSQKTGTSA